MSFDLVSAPRFRRGRAFRQVNEFRSDATAGARLNLRGESRAHAEGDASGAEGAREFRQADVVAVGHVPVPLVELFVVVRGAARHAGPVQGGRAMGAVG